jgi:hypothetical protein
MLERSLPWATLIAHNPTNNDNTSFNYDLLGIIRENKGALMLSGSLTIWKESATSASE